MVNLINPAGTLHIVDNKTVHYDQRRSTLLTGEKGPVPGQHPVPEVVGSVVAPLPGPEMWSRQVFSLYTAIKHTVMNRTLHQNIVTA